MSVETSTYTVAGMSCGGCATKVSTVVSELPGVSDVQVDITKAELQVSGDESVSTDVVRQAVEAAGYELRSTQT